ncbi:hypothetical protein RRG08_014237 [Elysia crispata]|uniref:Uncharacterized protein n=1 Tax=Elysia crispata TaxID=231223 RepID=A0AAE0XEH8_9GAST|nr:hypothetical protein RRG08_014237 [Elysia crispata]
MKTPSYSVIIFPPEGNPKLSRGRARHPSNRRGAPSILADQDSSFRELVQKKLTEQSETPGRGGSWAGTARTAV